VIDVSQALLMGHSLLRANLPASAARLAHRVNTCIGDVWVAL
jgi:hypothetical protein